jgi:hypothetical protein
MIEQLFAALFLVGSTLAVLFYSWHLFPKALEKDGQGRLPRKCTSSFLFSGLNLVVFVAIIATAVFFWFYPEIISSLPENLVTGDVIRAELRQLKDAKTRRPSFAAMVAETRAEADRDDAYDLDKELVEVDAIIEEQ